MIRTFDCLKPMFLALAFLAGPVLADRETYLELARRGWNYDLRTSTFGRDLSIPVHINGRDLSGSAICIVGEKPHPNSLVILNAFRDLAKHSFGKPLPMRYAGPQINGCGSGRTVVLRLFSGFPPNSALTRDLDWMNETYRLGLPSGRDYAASSPAMAQTFFGHLGQSTHIMVKQPVEGPLAALERAFFSSILIEELFQSFTFGMDIPSFDRTEPFWSKLQELPINVNRLNWDSRPFMRALLQSNPRGLCPFDVFMLHAVALSPADQTTDAGFIEYIDQRFDELSGLAHATLSDARFAPIIDRSCGTLR